MALARREALILGAIGAGAALAGGLLGALALQAQSGAADLLAAPFRDLSGARRTLREWRGRGVLCNFWATWCAPCREEPAAGCCPRGFSSEKCRSCRYRHRSGGKRRGIWHESPPHLPPADS